MKNLITQEVLDQINFDGYVAAWIIGDRKNFIRRIQDGESLLYLYIVLDETQQLSLITDPIGTYPEMSLAVARLKYRESLGERLKEIRDMIFYEKDKIDFKKPITQELLDNIDDYEYVMANYPTIMFTYPSDIFDNGSKLFIRRVGGDIPRWFGQEHPEDKLPKDWFWYYAVPHDYTMIRIGNIKTLTLDAAREKALDIKKLG